MMFLSALFRNLKTALLIRHNISSPEQLVDFYILVGHL